MSNQPALYPNQPGTSSSAIKNSPTLGHVELTVLLGLMCLTPVITILVLWSYLPPVFEGQLQASVYSQDLPSAEYYSIKYDKRPPYSGGAIVVQNNSDDEWTNINIQVNKHYQIYDFEPIPPRGEMRYELDKFITRSGARFSVRYNELKTVRVYARLTSRRRATYFYEF